MSRGRLLVSARTVTGQPDADAVLLEGDRVVAVDRAERIGADAGRVHLDGVIVPGLRDAHLHPVGIAASAHTPDLSGVASPEEMTDRITTEAATGSAVVAYGLDDERLGRLPTRHDLDGATGAVPALVYRVCSHIAVANTAALDLAGIGPDTPDPTGGAIDRDDAGIPTGVLRETAIVPVASALEARVPSPGPGEVLDALADLARRGLTRIDAIVVAGGAMWCGSGDELDQLCSVAADLPLTVDVFVIADQVPPLEAAADRLARLGDRIRFAGWKGFADGSLGGRTAALRSPYADAPEVSGTLRLQPERDGRLIAAAHRLGGVAAVHAIGDAAVEATLDLLSTYGDEGDRIEHASLLAPHLVDRMADQGVTASVQPLFAISDAAWLERRLGPERAAWAYPLRALADAGVPLVGGSDAPVEEPDPWAGIAAARTHGNLDPTESLGLFTAANLEPGSPADLLVTDRDPIASSPEQVAATRVLARWWRGAGGPVADLG